MVCTQNMEILLKRLFWTKISQQLEDTCWITCQMFGYLELRALPCAYESRGPTFTEPVARSLSPLPMREHCNKYEMSSFTLFSLQSQQQSEHFCEMSHPPSCLVT